MREAMRIAGYEELRREQAEKRERGEYMGIGVSFFTETVGAGPRAKMDIAGLGMADGAELRVHPTGKAVLRISVKTQGQGHETTFAQIVAEELGIPPEDVEVVHGDTDQTPFGLGTYGSRSTPVSGGGDGDGRAQGPRQGARLIAAAALEVSPDDLEWEKGRWFVKGDPEKGQTIQELALASHGALELPEGVEGHLDAVAVYDPPNLTYPYGAYICVVDVDPGTGEIKLRRFIAVDDCGVRINPMIVEGQIHGGLAEGVGIALMQHIAFDEQGNCLSGSFMDYLVPSSMEVPDWELGETVTPSPHHPFGAKGVGESANVGSPPAVVNAVVDALRAVRRAPRRHAGHAGAGLGGDADRHAGAPREAQRRELTRRASRSSRRPSSAARRRRSARPGDRAIVLGDGTIDGFVGGSCADATVRLQALRVLETGEPCCCGSCPGEQDGPSDEEGAVVVANPCLSGGALELFLEPHLPPPRVASPASRRSRARSPELAEPLGFRARAGALAEPGDFAAVVASLGHGDEEARPARARGRLRVRRPRRVARARRGRARRAAGRRRRRGGARARAHPGRASTIGARTHAEIALAILAELVAVRRAPVVPPAARRRPRPCEAVDPVCGMTVSVGPGTPTAGDVAFCSEGCREAWLARTA